MSDPSGLPGDTTTREWMRAVLVVGLGAVLTILLLAWFSYTFVAVSCCVAPSPGA